MESIDDLKPLRAFLAVLQAGSFVQAARQLHVVPSVVAKRIAQLEAALGVRLFERTTRRVQVTAAGERLRARAAALLAGMEELALEVAARDGQEAPHGHLRVMAPATLTTLHLGPLFARFLQQHPGITMEVVLGNRSTNPLEDGFDLIVSGRLASYEGVVQRPLAPIHYALCAAPAYLREAPALEHPADLARHACLVFEPLGRNWVFQSTRGALHVDVPARLLVDDNRAVLSAALLGLGIAMLPRYIAGEALARGELRPLLPAYPPQEAWFKAFIPRRKAGLPPVAALCDWLEAQMPGIDAPARAQSKAKRTPTRS
ncbi:LysR family transcriptional regulator [Ramlibacter sp. MAHUQ-53]|uniref:LysR family transcriptional regulator n=1 Tax=unclassified Ramlibacter TaxID=2617605 RepID=UPI00363A4D2A